MLDRPAHGCVARHDAKHNHDEQQHHQRHRDDRRRRDRYSGLLKTIKNHLNFLYKLV